jgi:hypothetical protein
VLVGFPGILLLLIGLFLSSYKGGKKKDAPAFRIYCGMSQ